MKRLFLAILLTLLLAALLVSAMTYDPGYILITYGLYTVETTVWVGVAILLAWLVLSYLLAALLQRAAGRSGAFGRRRRQRQQQRAQADAARGLTALAEGHPTDARKWLLRAADRSAQPLVPLLLAARATAAGGRLDEAVALTQRARQAEPTAEAAALLEEAALALAADRLDLAGAALQRLREQGGHQPRLLALQAELYERRADWEALGALLPELRREQVLPAAALTRLERLTWAGQLRSAAAAADATRLRELWRGLPKGAERDSELLAHYASGLAATGDGAGAAHLLAAQIRRDWDPALITLYGRVDGDAAKQLANVEQWLAERPTDPVLLLAAGRLAQRNQLWGKARSYLESALVQTPTPVVYAELAQLLAQLGESDASAALYRQGLQAALAAPPAPPALPGPADTVS